MWVMLELHSRNLSNTRSKTSWLNEQYLTAERKKLVCQSQQNLRQMWIESVLLYSRVQKVPQAQEPRAWDISYKSQLQNLRRLAACWCICKNDIMFPTELLWNFDFISFTFCLIKFLKSERIVKHSAPCLNPCILCCLYSIIWGKNFKEKSVKHTMQSYQTAFHLCLRFYAKVLAMFFNCEISFFVHVPPKR